MVQLLSCVRPFVTSGFSVRGFSRQEEYWRGLPFPSPGNPPDPGVEPGSPALHAGSLLTELHAITFWMHFFPTHYSDGLDL